MLIPTQIALTQCLTEDFNSAFNSWTNHGTSNDNSHCGNNGSCRALGTGDYLISPAINNPGSLEFVQDASNKGNGKSVTIQYRIGTSGSWVNCHTFKVNKNHSTITVDLTNINGVNLSQHTNVQFRFPSTFSTWYIDDVKIYCIAGCTPPTTQASNLSFSNITATSLDLSWVRGSGNEVIVVQRKGAAIDENPISGTNYAVNDTIGTNNTVIYKGTGNNITLNGLSPSTNYYFAIYEYNTADNCYLTPATTGNQRTLCGTPDIHATDINFTNITDSSMSINWTNGSGENRIIVAKKGSLPDWTPTDNTTYTANSNFANGTELNSGNYIIYNGTGNSVNVANLLPGTEYFFVIYEYNNCPSGTEKYFVNQHALNGNQKTKVVNVENLIASCITKNSITINWDTPPGSYEGILVTIRPNATPNLPTCQNGASYTNTNNNYTNAQTYCSTTSKYVYNGTGNSATITGLTNNTSYTIKVFTYQDNNWSTGTQITKNINIKDVENAVISKGNGQVNIGWANPTNCFDEIVVIGHKNGSVTSTPSGDASSYTADNQFGTGTDIGNNNYVVYKGSETDLTVVDLTNEINHCFKIYVRNGTEWSNGVEVCETPKNITILEPGDLMIMAVNTHDTGKNEGFTFVCFKDILPGTPIDFTDNGYAREYPNKWGTSEGTIRLTRANTTTTIPAGTSISIITMITNGKVASDFEVYVNGTEELKTGKWTIELLNATEGWGFDINPEDDIWIMQNGNWNENNTIPGPAVMHDDTYTGNILYGWTASGWGTGTGSKFSELYPNMDCFQTNVTVKTHGDKVKYTGPFTDTTQLAWIARMNDPNNWTAYPDNTAYANANPKYKTQGVQINIINGGYGEGIWIGTQNTDWFACGNWQNLRVPGKTTNVEIGTHATKNVVIDINSTNAAKQKNIAQCNNLTISEKELQIIGNKTDTLKVYGNITLSNTGKINMTSTGGKGHIVLHGNWDNQTSEANFIEGNGTINLNGTTTQNITSTDNIEIFNNLTINNTSAGEIKLNVNIRTNGSINHKDGDLNLNSKNIEIHENYTRIHGALIGNIASDISILGNGTIDDLLFINNFTLNNFTLNRHNANFTILTNLTTNNNITITNGTLNLSANHQYTVNNTLSTYGHNALILKSNKNNTASLLQKTGNTPATVERYTDNKKWIYYQTPLDNANTNILTTTSNGNNNQNLYFYNEKIKDYWKGNKTYNPSGWTRPNQNTKIQTDKGYILFTKEEQTFKVIGGNLQANDHNFTLSYTDNGTGPAHPTTPPIITQDWDEFEGWNLIGNPYTCTLNWNDIWNNLSPTEKTYIENGIYFYDSNTKKYKFYTSQNPTPATPHHNIGITINGGSQMIPASQAFFVKATPAGNGKTIKISKNARTHSSQKYYKKNNNLSKNEQLTLKIEKNNYTDETIIRTIENATDNKDYTIDAYKMFAWDITKPQIFTTNDTKTRLFSLNSIPPIQKNKTIKIGIYTGYTGKYKISLTNTSFNKYHITLEDKKQNKKQNLLDNPTYTFNENKGTITNRFLIHLTKNTPPKINTKINNQTTQTNKLWTLIIPKNTFIDTDNNDIIKLSATLKNNKKLPQWLTFENNTLYGTPKEPKTLEIYITATDKLGEQTATKFLLTIENQNTKIDNINNKIKIFPNPTNEYITIKFPQSVNKQTLKIISIDGKILKNEKISGKIHQINLSDYKKGTYYIEISEKNKIKTKKIIILK